MKVQIERDGDFIDINKVKIRIDNVDFRIYLNNFNELTIKKMEHGNGISAIVIIPNVSNQIIIK